MNFSTFELVAVGRLNIPRTSHSLVCVKDGIGVIGGYTTG